MQCRFRVADDPGATMCLARIERSRAATFYGLELRSQLSLSPSKGTRRGMFLVGHSPEMSVQTTSGSWWRNSP